MKRIFYLVLLGFMSLQVSAQSYTFTKSVGSSSPYSYINFPFSWNPTTTTTLITSTTGNNLSSWYTLPFNFSFYGKTVTGFYASPNGYITFDNTQFSSYPHSDTLKNADAPDNSIFAFWTPLTVKATDSLVIPSNGQNYLYTYSGGVVTWTTGLPGNRICYISWALVSNANLYPSIDNQMNFCIRLYEAGGFDIVYGEQMGNIGTNLTGVVGSKSWDNTTNTMVTNLSDPFLSYPGATASPISSFSEATQDVVLSFFYGSQPAVNVAIPSVVAPEQMQLSGADVSVYLVSRGSDAAGSYPYTLNWSVNGATPGSTTNPITINEGVNTYSLNIAGSSGFVLGTNTIKVWISAPGNVSTDTFATATTFVVSGTNSYEVHPVIEEPTGIWCGYCPDGIQAIDDLKTTYPDAIVVCLHSEPNSTYANTTQPNINDSLGTIDGQLIANNLQAEYPSYCINRINLPSTGTLSAGWALPAPGYQNNLLSDYASTRWQGGNDAIPQLSPVHVDVTQQYDVATNALTVTLSAKFSDSVMAYKLFYNAYLIEDGVKATPYPATAYQETASSYDEGWDQHIYAEYTDVDCIFDNYPGAITVTPGSVWAMPNFTYDHVLRAVLGGPTGVSAKAAGLPSKITFNTPYTYQFTTSLAPNWNYKNMSIVGFVNYIDDNPSNSNAILGANTLPISTTQTTSGIKQPEKSAVSIENVYPNPSNGAFTADIQFAQPTVATCIITDITGNVIMTLPARNFGIAIQSTNFNLTSLTPGIYFLTVKSDLGSSTQKIMVSR